MKTKSLFALKPTPTPKQNTESQNHDIASLIKRRRRQILVHSCIYYELNESLISDSQWSEWASELEELQSNYPEIASNVEYAKEFKDFDHSTGANLRDAYNQPDIVSLAIRLLHYK